MSAEERAQVASQLDELKATYSQLCDSSAAQLQQLEQQLAKEEERKVQLTSQVVTTAVLIFAKVSFDCRVVKTVLLKCIALNRFVNLQPCRANEIKT